MSNSPHRHLFFDLDKTVAPSRQPILPEMFKLLSSLPQDIVIVSGQDVDKIAWQSDELPAYRLGQNGNNAHCITGKELWNFALSDEHEREIRTHITALCEAFSITPDEQYDPIEHRGGQITFSPVGNTAPVDIKSVYDPNASKRLDMLEKIPFESEELVVKIGGSTSFDYIHKDRHKGTNVARLIEHLGWSRDDCVYYGDGLYPGGNDEAVIGVIETVAVDDHLHTFELLQVLRNR